LISFIVKITTLGHRKSNSYNDMLIFNSTKKRRVYIIISSSFHSVFAYVAKQGVIF